MKKKLKRSAALGLGILLSAAQAHEVDLKHLPLGDGKLSSGPKKEWIWPCHTDPNAGGAFRNGPWIKADGTYDLTAKAVISGSVTWPYRFEYRREGDRRIFTANDLPNHPTGTFPVPSTDEAFQYDRNPNTIQQQNIRIELPVFPQLEANASCAPGAVGVLLSGAVLFNALDGPGRDAVAHEAQDSCQGHPQESGVYHYHSLSSCVPDQRDASGHSKLVGYAIDGFGIYGHYGENGKALSSADLDECHGHTHEIEWEGKRVRMYHYHATFDFPYTIGCLRGKYSMSDVMAISGPPPGRHEEGSGADRPEGPPPSLGRRGQPPDLSAAAAALGVSVETLKRALGPPPPDIQGAAQKLGISLEKLRSALPPPPRRQ